MLEWQYEISYQTHLSLFSPWWPCPRRGSVCCATSLPGSNPSPHSAPETFYLIKATFSSGLSTFLFSVFYWKTNNWLSVLRKTLSTSGWRFYFSKEHFNLFVGRVDESQGSDIRPSVLEVLKLHHVKVLQQDINHL